MDDTKPSSDIHKLLLELYDSRMTIAYFDTENVPTMESLPTPSSTFNLNEYPDYVVKRVNALNYVLDRTLLKHNIYLMGYSAGGIVATLLANRMNVRRVICFGYPFNSPTEGDQNYRIKHLYEVKKPVLILQGITDEYGNKEDCLKYSLPDIIKISSIDTGHNCDNFSKNTYDFIRCEIFKFYHSNTLSFIYGNV